MGIDTKANYKRYIHADFSHIEVLQENKKERADTDKVTGEVWLQRFNSGVGSLNEWLSAIGNKEISLPVYTKKLGEMNPEELQTVKSFLNMKMVAAVVDDKQNKSKQNEGV